MKNIVWIVIGIFTPFFFFDFVLAEPSLDRVSSSTSNRSYEIIYNEIKGNNDLLGNVTSDLLLGKAALSLGKPDEAAMACERAYINDPDLPEAKLCLANSYYTLKQYERAQEILKNFSSDRKDLLREATSLLNKIKQKLAHRDRGFRLYGRMNYGYDNNAAATTDEDYAGMIALVVGYNLVPTFPPGSPGYDEQVAIINDLKNRVRGYNDKIKSEYIYPQIGVRSEHSFNNMNSSIYWDANFAHKEYFDVDGYNVDQANFTLGFDQKFLNAYIFNSTFYYQEYMLDGSRYRESPILSLGFGKIINENNVVRFYTEDGIFTYPNNREQSIVMYSGGVEWTYFDSLKLIDTRIFYGRNQPRIGAGGKAYNGSNYYGVKLSGKRKLTRDLSLALDITAQRSFHDDHEFINEPKRKDFFGQVAAGFYYRLAPGYVWYAQGAYINNYSNISNVYKYDRIEVFTGISFEL